VVDILREGKKKKGEKERGGGTKTLLDFEMLSFFNFDGGEGGKKAPSIVGKCL